jgi:hypothetical protein
MGVANSHLVADGVLKGKSATLSFDWVKPSLEQGRTEGSYQGAAYRAACTLVKDTLETRAASGSIMDQYGLVADVESVDIGNWQVDNSRDLVVVRDRSDRLDPAVGQHQVLSRPGKARPEGSLAFPFTNPAYNEILPNPLRRRSACSLAFDSRVSERATRQG